MLTEYRWGPYYLHNWEEQQPPPEDDDDDNTGIAIEDMFHWIDQVTHEVSEGVLANTVVALWLSNGAVVILEEVNVWSMKLSNRRRMSFGF